LPWSANLHVLTKCKSPEEREFYLRTALAQRWPVREVARRINGALFERAVLNPPKASTALREIHPGAGAVFRNTYFVEFLGLPDGHGEADLHTGLVQHAPIFDGARPRLLLYRKRGSERLQKQCRSAAPPPTHCSIEHNFERRTGVQTFRSYRSPLPGNATEVPDLPEPQVRSRLALEQVA
jgi:DUF1016 N-terminal domain